MSFSFRDRPTLRDRLRGKSGDQIMEELKQSIDQDWKKFFDSRPNWKQTPASSAFPQGFSFEDDIMPGKSKVQGHLEDLAQRHPEFAEHLKGWTDLDRRQEYFERQKEEEEKREEPGPLRSGNLRNTVPDMQSTSQTQDETDRGQRSQSAPPESKYGPSGQFVSKVDISGREEKQNTLPPQQEPSQQKVFHIPIYVEGRDEPILSKEATEGNSTPKQKKSTSRIPLHELQRDPHPKHHHQKTQTNASQATQPPPPPPAPSPPAQAPEQTVIKDPLSQVAEVLKEVNSLKEKVDSYKGNSKADKEYMYLDEMLTRNLLKLDNIDTEGKEEVRTARKEVIKRIQECITQLEAAPGVSSLAVVLAEPSQCCSDANKFEQEPMEVPQKESSS